MKKYKVSKIKTSISEEHESYLNDMENFVWKSSYRDNIIILENSKGNEFELMYDYTIDNKILDATNISHNNSFIKFENEIFIQGKTFENFKFEMCNIQNLKLTFKDCVFSNGIELLSNFFINSHIKFIECIFKKDLEFNGSKFLDDSLLGFKNFKNSDTSLNFNNCGLEKSTIVFEEELNALNVNFSNMILNEGNLNFYNNKKPRKEYDISVNDLEIKNCKIYGDSNINFRSLYIKCRSFRVNYNTIHNEKLLKIELYNLVIDCKGIAIRNLSGVKINVTDVSISGNDAVFSNNGLSNLKLNRVTFNANVSIDYSLLKKIEFKNITIDKSFEFRKELDDECTLECLSMKDFKVVGDVQIDYNDKLMKAIKSNYYSIEEIQNLINEIDRKDEYHEDLKVNKIITKLNELINYYSNEEEYKCVKAYIKLSECYNKKIRNEIDTILNKFDNYDEILNLINSYAGYRKIDNSPNRYDNYREIIELNNAIKDKETEYTNEANKINEYNLTVDKLVYVRALDNLYKFLDKVENYPKDVCRKLDNRQDTLFMLKESFKNNRRFKEEDITYLEYMKIEVQLLEIRKKFKQEEVVFGSINALKFLKWIGDFAISPFKVIIRIAITFISFGVIFGILINIYDYSTSYLSIRSYILNMLEGLYFSLITLATVGYGDISQATFNDVPYIKYFIALLSSFEGVLGVFLLSYLSVAVVRKTLR